MKKLMFAAAVIAAGVACADVTSANVVGYAQNNLKNGATGVGSQFVPISGEEIDLIDLVVTGYEGEQEGDINLQKLDENGKAVSGSTYIWVDIPGDDLYGWLDAKTEDPLERGIATVKPGEGWWCRAKSNKEAIQSAGQVANAPVQVNLVKGAKFVLNPTPVAINFNDDDENGKFIAVGGYTADQEGDINIQKVDENGKAVSGSTFIWVDIPGDDLYGWLDAKTEDPIEGIQLLPGEAIYARGVSDKEYISFPGAL